MFSFRKLCWPCRNWKGEICLMKATTIPKVKWEWSTIANAMDQIIKELNGAIKDIKMGVGIVENAGKQVKNSDWRE